MFENVSYIYIIPTIVIAFGYLANKFYFSGGVCKSKKRLDGKRVIITGANTGIGFETALDLAKRGATVILACRDLNKARAACDKIKLETKSDLVFVEKLDLASLESIRDFAKNYQSKFSRLDILINNAGSSGYPYTKTKDGFEMQFGSMHLGHFYLTGLLIESLKASSQSRIINISSIGHKFIGDIKWNDLMMKEKYRPFKAYSQAKLANCLFTIELANKFKENNITAVSLHPGVVRTEIWRHLYHLNIESFVFFLFYPIFLFTTKNCRQGAQTTIHCAVADEIPYLNGSYFADCKVSNGSVQSRNQLSAKRLWEISEKLTDLKY